MAVLEGANIINCSFRFYSQLEQFDAFEKVIDMVGNENILIISGSGNEGVDSDCSVSFWDLGPIPVPASFPSSNILSVASNGCDRTLSSFSNFNSQCIDIAAPGESVRSLGLGGSTDVIMSGTSQSTAIITGVAAALGTYQTQFDAEQIKCAIISSVDQMNLEVLSNGVIDASSALEYLLSSVCDEIENSKKSNVSEQEQISTNSDIIERGDWIINEIDLSSERINPLEHTNIIVYPSPASNFIGVQFMASEEADGFVLLKNLQGQTLQTKGIPVVKGQNTPNMNVSGWPNGIYIVQLGYNNEIYTKRVLIRHN